MGATLGVAVFGTLFTSRLADNLTGALTDNAAAGGAGRHHLAGRRSCPSAVKAAGEPLRTAIVDAYANSLAPVFWYLVPILAVALLLALFLKEIPLSESPGMVARGEAVESEEELAATSWTKPGARRSTVVLSPGRRRDADDTGRRRDPSPRARPARPTRPGISAIDSGPR